jgi:hypothetical protein
MDLEPEQLFIFAADNDELTKLHALLGGGDDLTPELAIEDFGEQVDFVIGLVLEDKDRAHVMALLKLLLEAANDLAGHL